jgi:flagellar biosynthesis protein FlhA
MQALHNNNATGAAIEPGMAETLSRQTEAAAKQQEQLGMTPVLLVPSALRATLSKFLRRAVPHLRVLSHEELPDSKTIRVTSLIGGQA